MDKESTASLHPTAADAAITKYNAAKKALAEAHSIDEVKDIRDWAVAFRTYAMQARDRVLIDHAAEIRLRAERRAGELLKQMDKNQGGVAGKTGSKGRPVLDSRATLADLNINRSQSSRWQKLADMSKDKFEEVVTRGQQKASAAIDRAQNKPKPNPRSKGKQSGKRDKLDIIAACVSEVELIVRAAIAEIRDKEARAGLAQQLSNALQAIFAEALEIDQRYIEQQAATEPEPEPVNPEPVEAEVGQPQPEAERPVALATDTVPIAPTETADDETESDEEEDLEPTSEEMLTNAIERVGFLLDTLFDEEIIYELAEVDLDKRGAFLSRLRAGLNRRVDAIERAPVLDKADAIAALPESVKAYFRMHGRVSNCDIRWYMKRFPALNDNKLEDSERRAIADKLIRDMLQRGELIKVKCKRDVYKIATETALSAVEVA